MPASGCAEPLQTIDVFSIDKNFLRGMFFISISFTAVYTFWWCFMMISWEHYKEVNDEYRCDCDWKAFGIVVRSFIEQVHIRGMCLIEKPV